MNRPLLEAYFLADAEVLGKLVRQGGDAREGRHRLVSHDYFEALSEHGLLRDDLGAESVAFAFVAMLEGFIQAQAAEPSGSDLEGRAELLALTVRRAFETERSLSATDEKTIAAQVVDLFARLSAADRATSE
jgi:hypothetical protein